MMSPTLSLDQLRALLAPPSPWFRLRCGGRCMAVVAALEMELVASVGVAHGSSLILSPERQHTAAAHLGLTASPADVSAGHDDAASSHARSSTLAALNQEVDAERERALNDADNQEGGFLPCITGDRIGGKYILVRELGRGESSKVWLAKLAQPSLAEQHRELDGGAGARDGPPSHSPPFAVKVYRCEDRLKDSMEYERLLMRFVCRRTAAMRSHLAGTASANSSSGAGSPTRSARLPSDALAEQGDSGPLDASLSDADSAGICSLRDDFVQTGPHGEHPCLVFDVLGPAVDWVMKAYDFQGIPHRGIVQDIVRATLRTLIQLDRINVVHTDLKPENLLFVHDEAMLTSMMDSLDTGRDADAATDFSVRFIDFGLSYIIPPEHRSSAAAGVLSSSPGSSPSKPRSSLQGAISKEEKELLHLGNYQKGAVIQTREYRAPEILLGTHFGTRADVWSLGCMVFELVTGQFLFDPKSHPDVSDESTMDSRHLYEISTVVGAPPPLWLQRGRGEHTPAYFDVRSWKFKGARPLRSAPVRDLVADLAPFTARYCTTDAAALTEARHIADFVLKCITWDPAKRASPQQLYDHPWLR